MGNNCATRYQLSQISMKMKDRGMSEDEIKELLATEFYSKKTPAPEERADHFRELRQSQSMKYLPSHKRKKEPIVD